MISGLRPRGHASDSNRRGAWPGNPTGSYDLGPGRKEVHAKSIITTRTSTSPSRAVYITDAARDICSEYSCSSRLCRPKSRPMIVGEVIVHATMTRSFIVVLSLDPRQWQHLLVGPAPGCRSSDGTIPKDHDGRTTSSTTYESALYILRKL